MSRKDPKLSTKYENDDPEYTSESSSSDKPADKRSQPKRSAKKSSELDIASQSECSEAAAHETVPLTVDSDTPDQISAQTPFKNHQFSPQEKNIITNSQSEKSKQETNDEIYPLSFLFSSVQSQSSSMAPTLEEEMITRITKAVIESQIKAQAEVKKEFKTRTPYKVDLLMLSKTNYMDWARKMKFGLQLNDLWIDPAKNPTDLEGEDVERNKLALKFMGCYLDSESSTFINDENDQCFITAWNHIKQFHQPKTATALTDIHRKIQAIKHQAGESIESHLMKLEAQFTRFQEIDKKLSDDHIVALILSSVSDSPDFANFFHSAMWTDESTLTIAKVKTILIATQRRQTVEDHPMQANFNQQRNFSNPSYQNSTVRKHNRRPKDTVRGWKCSVCEMDNHTKENCWRRKPNHRQQHQNRGQNSYHNSKSTRRANQVDEEVDLEPNSNAAQAYAGDVDRYNQWNNRYTISTREADEMLDVPSTSIRSRLGEPVAPYQNDDVLEINYDDYDDVPPFGSSQESRLLKSPSGNNVSQSHSQIANHSFSQSTQNIKQNINKYEETEVRKSSSHQIQQCMNHFNVLNFKKCFHSNHLNLKLNTNQNLPKRFATNNIDLMKLNKSEINSTSESFWIVDSGATLHMCKSSDSLTNFVPHSGHNVIISDGSTIPIQGYGTLIIWLNDRANNSTHKLILNNVAFVPKLSVNLISVRALATSLDVPLKFTKDSCFIQHPKATILLATISNSSYTLRIKNAKSTQFTKDNSAMACIHEWHRKLGHRNLAHIHKIKNTLKLKVEKCSCTSECIGCLKGKLHALPFPQISDKPMEPRDIVTTDVCGPFRTSSLGGANYFVTFTCANTDYTEVAAIKSKSECKTELMNFVKRCMTQFGRFPKIIRSDRGGEYLDGELQTYLRSNGIVFQCTVPRCPEQNGISERKNRTLLEGIRTTLITKNLPKFLWAEALHHVNNTFNNIPKEPESPSPKEKYTNSISNFPFIEFGSPVFYTTNPLNRSKLAERGEAGIFVGIDSNSKGYRIFTNGKIRVERHVKFIAENKIIEQPNSSSEILHNNNNSSPSIQLQTETEPINEPRRSERIRLRQAHATSSEFEPKTYKQAISCPEKHKWIMAMESELKSIKDNNTWSSVELPKGRNAIGCRWVFKIKQGESEESTRYKARLVAQGFTQKFGIDYDEVFAPVTRSSTFRTLLTVASARNLVVQQYDVKSAFLHGTLSEEIYMKHPPGSCETNTVLRLHKSLYGLKQAARVWNQTLHKAMTNEGFKQSRYDECLYVYKDESNICYAIVHVDDMIFASNSLTFIQTKIESLNKSFELKCLGNVKNYLGIEVSRDNKGFFTICQSTYIMKVATEFQLENSKGSKFPLDPGYHKLINTDFLETNNDYRKLIGMLLYISTNTRPDISAAVGILAQRVAKPRQLDLTEALRIVRYLTSTKDIKLHMFDEKETISLTAYTDSDWAEDRLTRKSISGVICKVLGGTVSWSSRKQDIVSTSTTEAEFYALSEAVKEVQWLRNILHDFHVNINDPIVINSDNQSTIKMVENSKFSSRTKHIDVRLHFVRDCVSLGKIKLKYCSSEDNVADLLTKPLAGVKISQLRQLAGLN